MTGGLIILVVIGGIAWWLFSPLVVHTTGSATNPFAKATSAPHAPAPTSTANIAPTPVGPVILATGKFIDKPNSGVGLANDRGSGNVTIGRTTDAKYIIYLDNLDVTNGPDLHVYLAPTSNASDAEQVKREGTDLGILSATQGSVNVPIPADLAPQLTKFHSVVIVCKTFSVIFTTAPLVFS